MNETAIRENVATQYNARQPVHCYVGTNRYSVFGGRDPDAMHGILDIRTSGGFMRCALNWDVGSGNAGGFLFHWCSNDDREGLGIRNFGKNLRWCEEW